MFNLLIFVLYVCIVNCCGVLKYSGLINIVSVKLLVLEEIILSFVMLMFDVL